MNTFQDVIHRLKAPAAALPWPAVVVTLTAMVLAASAPATAADKPALQGSAAMPASPGLQAAPLAAKAPLNAAGEGRRAFLQFNCYGCHGMYAAGGMGPNIIHAESGDISEAVKQGEEGGMPSFHNLLSRTNINNLGAYLRSIGTPSEPKFMDWWVPVPTK